MCEGDCDSDADCAEGLHCFQRSHPDSPAGIDTPVPGCDSGGSGDAEGGDYCFKSPESVFRRRRSSWSPQSKPQWKCEGEEEHLSQYSVYVEWFFDSPTLREVGATNISVAIEWEDFALAPWQGGGGVFAAWRVPGGYFGAQVWGKGETAGQFIFSIWDSDFSDTGKTSLTWPLDLQHCHRNCQDCSEEESTGTKCILDYPLMRFGGRYNIRFHRTRKLMTINTGDYRSHEEGLNVDDFRDITGSEWTMTVQASDGVVQQVGRILFEDKNDGMYYVSGFLEALGCRHCAAMYHRETRYGPFLTEPDGSERRPSRAERLAKSASWCELYRITGSKSDSTITFEGGPGAIKNFPNDSDYHPLW